MNVCSDKIMGIYELIGIFLKIFKFIIPLIIIALGSFSFFKAMTSSKEITLKKESISLIKKIVAGILIFLLPNIVLYLFEITGFDKSGYSCIYNCVLDLKCENDITETQQCTVETEECISKAIFID